MPTLVAPVRLQRRKRLWVSLAIKVVTLLFLLLFLVWQAAEQLSLETIHWVEAKATLAQGATALQLNQDTLPAVVRITPPTADPHDHVLLKLVAGAIPGSSGYASAVFEMVNLNTSDLDIRVEYWGPTSQVDKLGTKYSVRLPHGKHRLRLPMPLADNPASSLAEVKLFFSGVQGPSQLMVRRFGLLETRTENLKPPAPEPPAAAAGPKAPPEPPAAPAPKAARPSDELGAWQRVRWRDLPRDSQELLDLLARSHASWFLCRRDVQTGLVPDRAPPWLDRPARCRICSVAGQGMAFCVFLYAEERGWLESGAAVRYGEQALRFLMQNSPRRLGLLPHFVDLGTGSAAPGSEFSTIDMGIFLSGACLFESFAPGSEAARLAAQFRKEVEWDRLLVGSPRALTMGLRPDGKEFLPSVWRGWNEGPLAYVIAGAESPTCAAAMTQLAQEFPPTRLRSGPLAGKQLPLFVHQYPLLFIGAEAGMRLGPLEPYAVGVRATLYNQRFCEWEGQRTFREGFFGISACDTPTGYRALAPVAGMSRGVCCPGVVLASAPFCLREVAQAMSNWRAARPEIWRQIHGLGFVDSFCLQEGGTVWVDADSISITVGAAVLGLAEARDASISRLFRAAPRMKDALRACGFTWEDER